MASIFTRIIRGEIPSYKVAENEHCFAFLDINPLAAGHTLVVPKAEVDYLFDLEPAEYARLGEFARGIAIAMGKVIACRRIGVAVVGLEVPHAHIHLIPVNGVHDIDFSKPRVKMTPEELKATAEKISAAFTAG